METLYLKLIFSSSSVRVYSYLLGNEYKFVTELNVLYKPFPDRGFATSIQYDRSFSNCQPSFTSIIIFIYILYPYHADEIQ